MKSNPLSHERSPILNVIMALVLGLLLLALAWVEKRWWRSFTYALVGAGALWYALNSMVVLFVS